MAAAVMQQISALETTYPVTIERLPEGVWLASSDAIPGLFVEGDTMPEVANEATVWAKELLVDAGMIDPADEPKLVFTVAVHNGATKQTGIRAFATAAGLLQAFRQR